jgi:tol-pal system protein YbgF
MILEKVSKTMENQTAGAQNTNQALLKEIRTLAAKMDDSATLISALAQQVADLKVQAKPLAPASGGEASDESLYNQAYNDYVQGNFDLAIQGFTAYLGGNPGGSRAADAQFYMGDAYSAQSKLREAIIALSHVIDEFPASDKVASALYKRGTAQLAMQQTDNAIADFRDVVEKFPESPEAERAQSQLRSLGVSPKKQAPAKATPRRK